MLHTKAKVKETQGKLQAGELEKVHSFFEDGENNFYEYMKYVRDLDEEYIAGINPYTGEKQAKPIKNKRKSLFLLAKSIEGGDVGEKYAVPKIRAQKNISNDSFSMENKDKVYKELLEVYNINKNLKNDRFFVPMQSPRDRRHSGEKESDRENDSNDIPKSNPKSGHDLPVTEPLTYDQEIEKIKEKKLIKIFNGDEIAYKNGLIKELNQKKLPKEEIEKRLLEIKANSVKSIMDNNVILIRPQILASHKQVQYEGTLEKNKSNYMYLLIKKLQAKKGFIDEKDVAFKLKNYEEFIDNHNKSKLREKLNMLNWVPGEEVKEDINEEEKKNSLELDDMKPKTVLHRGKTKKGKRDNCCKKLSLFFFGDPMKPKAKIRHIWAGENGRLNNEYQDHRIYPNEIKK